MANLPNAKKPAIFLAKNASKKQILAIAALYKQQNSQGRQVVVIAEESNPARTQLNALVQGIKINNKITPKKFIISVKKPDSDIENVQWQQDKDHLNIYITATKGNLASSDIKFTATGSDNDLVILPGINDLSEVLPYSEKNKEFFMENKLFAIGSDLNLDEKYDHTSSNKPSLTTLAEQVYASMDGQSLTPEVAQLLLSGIFLETDNLRRKVNSSEIFLTMKRLVDKGAKTEMVVSELAKLEIKSKGQVRPQATTKTVPTKQSGFVISNS